MSDIGASPERVDAVAKVTGRASYLANARLEGVVHAGIVRSTRPHAVIRRIETSAARQAPGVLAVVTGEDLTRLMPEPYWGPAVLDQSALAIGRVRHIGEPVAAVVAATPEQAEAAAALVDVDYDDLPAVFDPKQALAPGAPLIHEQVRPARAFEDLSELRPAGGTNVNIHYRLRRGDVDQALATADVVVEDTYAYSRNQFCALEPHLAIAQVGAAGAITVWSTTQSPYIVRGCLATMFGVPPEKARVIVGHLGGGYGGKTYMKVEPLAVALAMVTGRRVQVALSQEEEFFLVNNHAATVRLKLGATRDGRLVAAECEVIWDSGAFADIGPRIAQKSGMTAAGPYEIPNVRIDSYSVYTNLPPTGPVRGFGVPQVSWAYESHIDALARRLGIAPLAMRRLNLLRPGRPHATGTIMRGIDLDHQLADVEAALDREPVDQPTAPGARIGRGIALGLKAVLTPSASEARIEIDATGSVTVYSSAVEMGQGTSTVLAQIAAEGLGLPLERVRCVFPDTDVTPYDLLTAGSRTTHHVGRAVLDAAQALHERLITAASGALDREPADLRLEGDEIVSQRDPTVRIRLGELVRQAAGVEGRLDAAGAYHTEYEHADRETGQSALITNHWFSGAAGAEVEVDPTTGQVRLRRLVIDGDAGHAINPANCHRQLSGAAVMGLGHALMEQVLYDGGQPTNASFVDYKVPSIRDLPNDFVTIVDEIEAVGGPAGAKGIGETGLMAIAPAIAGAIEDAVGVRVRELPITPERVYRALQAKASAAQEASA